jgi:ribosome-binding factor A
MDQRRVARVAESIREELSQIIGFEMKDPRLVGVTVAEVRVTPDGREAHIRVMIYGTPEEQKDAMAGLQHAKGHLRHEIGHRMELRHVPELFFETDTGTEAATRVEELLRRVRKNRRELQ